MWFFDAMNDNWLDKEVRLAQLHPMPVFTRGREGQGELFYIMIKVHCVDVRPDHLRSKVFRSQLISDLF